MRKSVYVGRKLLIKHEQLNCHQYPCDNQKGSFHEALLFEQAQHLGLSEAYYKDRNFL